MTSLRAAPGVRLAAEERRPTLNPKTLVAYLAFRLADFPLDSLAEIIARMETLHPAASEPVGANA